MLQFYLKCVYQSGLNRSIWQFILIVTLLQKFVEDLLERAKTLWAASACKAPGEKPANIWNFLKKIDFTDLILCWLGIKNYQSAFGFDNENERARVLRALDHFHFS